MVKYKKQYVSISTEEKIDNSFEPFLPNPSIPGLDSLALYCLLAIYNPSKYIEIGSGNSTKFARKSIQNHGLQTELISIDPQPRSEIDTICDKIIRKPVELINLAVFDTLKENDILFVDNSHRCFMNSDVTVTFLDILPSLKPGVLVQIHDIFLPYDYPPNFADRFYCEQYLLAAYLLAEGQRIDILLPNKFISKDPLLSQITEPIYSDLRGVENTGGSFWLMTK